MYKKVIKRIGVLRPFQYHEFETKQHTYFYSISSKAIKNRSQIRFSTNGCKSIMIIGNMLYVFSDFFL